MLKITQINGPFINNNLAQNFGNFFCKIFCQRFYDLHFILYRVVRINERMKIYKQLLHTPLISNFYLQLIF